MKPKHIFHEITARFQTTGSCGHLIMRGDAIGYDRAGMRTRCEACWRNMKERAAKREHRGMMEGMRVG